MSLHRLRLCLAFTAIVGVAVFFVTCFAGVFFALPTAGAAGVIAAGSISVVVLSMLAIGATLLVEEWRRA